MATSDGSVLNAGRVATGPSSSAAEDSDGSDHTDGFQVVPSETEPSWAEPGVSGGARGTDGKDEHKGKIGHRRVDKTGAVTYKKKSTSELMAAIQLGIGQSIGGLSSKPERDLLMQDFAVIESVFYPSEGSNLTPAHHYSDFRFKTYAPIAFRYFRELFSIQTDDFLVSLCDQGLKELSNPGASGSIFYLSEDDEFIIKTVQHKEAEFLQKLLPGYYMNLNQNPRTLLPKFYGFYCYQCGGKNIRFVIMNNLLPSSIKLHEKYDLKGSTYKRKASKTERAKSSPTLKDLDFMNIHPEGILLEKDKYDALIKTIQRDCRVLESFKIMDYSLLLGVYNLDAAARQKKSSPLESSQNSTTIPDISSVPDNPQKALSPEGLSESGGRTPRTGNAPQRSKSIKTRLAQYTTAIESITAQTEPDEEEDDDDEIPPGGIPAKNNKNERLLLYLGIIDVLQSYRLKKKLEHTMKSIVIDADSISVHRPSYYSHRFQDFMSSKVFKKVPTPLRHSPSKRKPAPGKRLNTTSESETLSEPVRSAEPRRNRTISFHDSENVPTGTKGGRPDLLPENSTPPPTFAEAISNGSESTGTSYRTNLGGNATFQPPSNGSSFPVSPKMSSIRGSPPLSLSESTPTHTEHTEGTPTYTPSSPSCYSDIEPAFQGELDKDESVHVAPSQTSTGFVPHNVSETSQVSGEPVITISASSDMDKTHGVKHSGDHDQQNSSVIPSQESVTSSGGSHSGLKSSVAETEEMNLFSGNALHGWVSGGSNVNIMRSNSVEETHSTNFPLISDTNPDNSKTSKISGEFILQQRRVPKMADLLEADKVFMPITVEDDSIGDEQENMADPEEYATEQARRKLQKLLANSRKTALPLQYRNSDVTKRSSEVEHNHPRPMSIQYYKPVALRRFTYLPGNELQYSFKKDSQRETTHL